MKSHTWKTDLGLNPRGSCKTQPRKKEVHGGEEQERRVVGCGCEVGGGGSRATGVQPGKHAGPSTLTEDTECRELDV